LVRIFDKRRTQETRDDDRRGQKAKVRDAEGMRTAGRLAADLLDLVEREIRAGMSTEDVNQIVADATASRGAISAPLGYRGFPAHSCISINEVVCHGIPSRSRVLRDGDIVNVDVTPIVDGFHGDSSRTFLIGDVAPAVRRLVEDTYTALWLGIAAVRPGGRIGDIGHAIQQFAEARGYSIVRQFSGHGIGRQFHTAPVILHYGKAGSGPPIEPGMTFTIEPMINLGDWRCYVLDDGWTAVTADGSLSAQFEHTLLVTETGVEVLTLGRNEVDRQADSQAEPRAASRG
jgi:methionyl aminopeptidase